MSLSMYQASVPVFVRGLKVLKAVLEKGAAHAAQTGTDPNALVQARLAPDMLDLAGQIQRASDTSKLSVARLSGVAAPAMPDTETTLVELIARIDATLAYVEGVAPESLEGSEAKTVELPTGGAPRVFNGADYLLGFGIPNFYFHVTTAYDILRSQGVPVGKRDFLGAGL